MIEKVGIGGYQYDLNVENKTANFKFWDPEDTSNTAEVSIPEKDFPDTAVGADERSVADLAYSMCSKSLNE
jgi:hypothetical protein